MASTPLGPNISRVLSPTTSQDRNKCRTDKDAKSTSLPWKWPELAAAENAGRVGVLLLFLFFTFSFLSFSFFFFLLAKGE